MVALVSTRTELRRAGVNSYFGLCPFHDERTRVVPRPPRREALPLLRLPGVGRPVRLRDGDRGARLQGGARVARRPLRGEARDRGRGPGGGRSPRSAASGCTRCWAARPPTTRATCGRRARPAPAREYLLGRGLDRGDAAGVPGRLRAERLGPDPARLARRRVQRRGAAGGRARAALAQRAPASVYDRFRERIMFPAADARGRVLGFGARAMRDNQRPEVPQHRPTASSTTSARSCSGSTSRARRRAEAGG